MNIAKLDMTKLSFASPDFEAQLLAMLTRDQGAQLQVEHRVQEIITQVRTQGDAALLSLTQRLDHNPLSEPAALKISPFQLEAAYNALSPALQQCLEQCAQRIRDYHQQQLARLSSAADWQLVDEWGNQMGQRVTAIERVGLYVPGGKAAYPSSVLMNAIPAQVAGVNALCMVVPAPGGELNPLVLAAAHIAEITEVYQVGGAQAIAAMAYGTDTIARVDKIVGPGNQYVATAKRMVFGQVGIDMVAGPSEVLIVADESVNPDWIAMDLFAQAEHDEMAQSLLLTAKASVVAAVEASIQRLLPNQPRSEIIKKSLSQFGALIHVESVAEAIGWVNRIAPEHLQVMLTEAEAWLPSIRHAGAIFLGPFSAESLGDYCLGPSHVLPTSGSARFSSPLSIDDFQKKSSIMRCSEAGARALSSVAECLATAEQLSAHAASAAYRQ